jgi:hypothetical protein
VFARRATIDADGRTIENQRTTTLQLPVLLLVFLGYTSWLVRTAGAPTSREVRRQVPKALILAFSTWIGASGCTGDGAAGAAAASGRGPDRRFVEASWDTLVHLSSQANDSLLFAAGKVAADAHGFWIGDHYGARVARFDWEGRLLGYAGERGGGPGELAGVRHIDLDEDGNLWVLDPENARVTAFDRDRAFVGEVSIRGLEANPDAFAVSRDGRTFHFMLATEQLQPVLLGRDGRVTRGAPIPVPEAGGAWGMALQGLIARERGTDRWVYAFSSGDGFLGLSGVEPLAGIAPYRESVPFAGIVRSVTREGRVTSTTTQLTERTPSAGSVVLTDGVLHVLFRGTTVDAGLLLDRYDLATGAYLDTTLLPRSGSIALWEDRIVVAGNDPVPEVLVLRRRS